MGQSGRGRGKGGSTAPRPLKKDETARIQKNLTKEQKERMLKDRRNYSAKNSSYKANLKLNEQRRQQDKEKELLAKQQQEGAKQSQQQAEQQKQLRRQQQQEAGSKREQQRKDAKAQSKKQQEDAKAQGKKAQEELRKQRNQERTKQQQEAKQRRADAKKKKSGKVHVAGEEDELDMPQHWLAIYAHEVLRDMQRWGRIAQLYCLPSCCGPRLPEPLTLSEAVIRRHRISRFQLRRMLLEFRFVDRDRSGHISLEEFLQLMGEQMSSYSRALFRLVDRDSDGLLSFDEFVCMLGNFCVYDTIKMLEFIFVSFNDDGTTAGLMHQNHFLGLQRMIRQDMKDTWTQGVRKVRERRGETAAERAEEARRVEGERAAVERAFLQRVELDMRKIGRSHQGSFITLPEFGYWAKKNRLLLYPAYRLQHKLQRRTLGTWQWGWMTATDRSRRALLLHLSKNDGHFPPLSCYESWVLNNFGWCKFRSVLGAEDFDAKWGAKHPTYEARKQGVQSYCLSKCWPKRAKERRGSVLAEGDKLPTAQGRKISIKRVLTKCCTCAYAQHWWRSRRGKTKAAVEASEIGLLPYHHQEGGEGSSGGSSGGSGGSSGGSGGGGGQAGE
jgi:Ca2+-binding EF-hand superfamily protein/uncharacterized membrane protein YgcG